MAIVVAVDVTGQTQDPRKPYGSSRIQGERMDVGEAVVALRRDAASGALSALCAELGIDLLVLFGSTLDDPVTAGDVDLAYSFETGRPGDDLAVVAALGDRYGFDNLDCMPLERADSVALLAALYRGEVLVERTPAKFAEYQVKAYGLYRDNQHLRDVDLEVLAR